VLVVRVCLQGRGVVMIGGGLRYIMSAWVAVHLLRSSGCRLPIEMWYPLAEAPVLGLLKPSASWGLPPGCWTSLG